MSRRPYLPRAHPRLAARPLELGRVGSRERRADPPRRRAGGPPPPAAAAVVLGADFGAITALAASDDGVYVGTDDGQVHVLPR